VGGGGGEGGGGRWVPEGGGSPFSIYKRGNLGRGKALDDYNQDGRRKRGLIRAHSTCDGSTSLKGDPPLGREKKKKTLFLQKHL